MTPEERFIGLRQSAACVHLSREQESELVAITANLFEERELELGFLANRMIA